MNILITGAGSGFGELIVRDLLAAGHRVAGSMRDIAGRNADVAARLAALGVDVVEIDVTDTASVDAGVAEATARLGQIDVLINNAGIGVHGLQEAFTPEDFRALFEINVFGVQRMIRAVAPAMRARGKGVIVQISSLLGRVALPFYGPYNASKWALEAMTENYRAELSGFGVEMVLVEPGGFPTGFMANLMHPADGSRDASYGPMAAAPAETLKGFEAFLADNPQQDPQLVADAVVGVIAQPHGARPFRTTVDTIGMGAAVEGYNTHLAEVTEGLFASLGIEGMLNVALREDAAA